MRRSLEISSFGCLTGMVEGLKEVDSDDDDDGEGCWWGYKRSVGKKLYWWRPAMEDYDEEKRER